MRHYGCNAAIRISNRVNCTRFPDRTYGVSRFLDRYGAFREFLGGGTLFLGSTKGTSMRKVPMKIKSARAFELRKKSREWVLRGTSIETASGWGVFRPPATFPAAGTRLNVGGAGLRFSVERTDDIVSEEGTDTRLTHERTVARCGVGGGIFAHRAQADV